MSNDIILVKIVEKTVLGLKSYSAQCLNCNWKSKIYNKETSAVIAGKKHKKHIGELK